MINKLVSVNITTYNRANLLIRCLNSILKQSYQNIEIIIVDDCSVDNTKEIVRAYQKKDSRIKYFRHNLNKGNASSRNTALENCNGFYISFMDDDDEWIDNDKIKKQVKIFENSHDKYLAIICSGIMRVDKNENEIIEYAKKPKDLKLQVLLGGLIHNSTAMVKKEIIEKVGGFDINMPRGVDSDFFRRVIVKYGHSVVFMNDITTKYYENVMVRMTDSRSIKSLKRDIKSNELCLSNYEYEFEEFKYAKIIRKQRYTRTYIKLLILEFNIINIKKFLKFLIK